LLDRERVLAKIDVLNGYLRELREILPASFEEYRKVEKRRACERLLQVSIECAIDICGLIVTGLRLGLPTEEDDLFEKLEQAGIISPARKEALKRMKGFRNILVHEYGRVDDLMVYEVLQTRMDDFETFNREILKTVSAEH
jgi:uncharacterized protein YutE (UPF0331/DUF86 family)